jgi:phosphoglycerate dehydrogenase-like enzyme
VRIERKLIEPIAYALSYGVGRRGANARADLLVQLLAESSVLIVGVPLTEATRGLVGSDELGAMKPGGYLVDVARGPVVD